MPQNVGSHPSRPCRQPLLDLQPQAAPQRVATDPAASSQLAGEPPRGEQRCVGVSPVLAVLVSDLAQPPVDKPCRAVDRGHQTRLRATALCPLAEPDVELAKPTQVRAPVTDVEHHRLVNPQPQPTPQRGSEVVPRGGQILAGLRDRVPPTSKERFDLGIRRRHSDDAQPPPRTGG